MAKRKTPQDQIGADRTKCAECKEGREKRVQQKKDTRVIQQGDNI